MPRPEPNSLVSMLAMARISQFGSGLPVSSGATHIDRSSSANVERLSDILSEALAIQQGADTIYTEG
jgi:hypothetical protein